MDNLDYSTVFANRKRGAHLDDCARGAIEALTREGYKIRSIATIVGCSPATVWNELHRGTPPRKGSKGRPPRYSAKRGAAVYKDNRSHSRKLHKIENCGPFVHWVCEQVRINHWSLDACVGYAREHSLFPKDEMVCTKTLYNEVRAGNLPIHLLELPEAAKRKKRGGQCRKNKKIYGRSIEERPEIAGLSEQFGHWEIDTVQGKRGSKESVVLTLLEKKSRYYMAVKIQGKTSDAVMASMSELQKQFGDRFGSVFKTITADNGSEFSDLAEMEKFGTQVYFAHPYSAWERAQDERHNGILRRFLPKKKSVERFTAEEILAMSDEMNALPRRKLGYRTPEELFDDFLDQIYAV